MTTNRAELLQKVSEVLLSETSDPVAEIRAMGKAMVAIADALEGSSTADARAVMSSVATLYGVQLR